MHARPLGLAILGSTGSVGTQTLDVVGWHPERFRVVALAAGSNHALLADQARAFAPQLVVCDDDAGGEMAGAAVMHGEAGLIAAATHPDVDIVVVATSGHAAIAPTYEAVKAGKTIALANKETVVCAGGLIMPFAQEQGIEIRPMDSEHSAIWQAMGGSGRREIRRLILTASGGPFRDATPAELSAVTVAQALAHPTWSMGGKITIDSATMMNKGLEIIEARWLFDVDYDRIDVVVHPESIVHSLVEYVDGSQIAQLSLPDMRLPIQYALTYPEHAPSGCRQLSLTDAGSLRFMKPNHATFPALSLAKEVGKAGGLLPTVLSTADEVAVEAFLYGWIAFPAIVEVVRRTLDSHRSADALSFEAIAQTDRWARTEAAQIVRQLGR